MKLCVFQGTFNPIHNAHLRVAKFLQDKYDKILFIPALDPPHKNIELSKAFHRLNMVKLATEDYEKFETSDIEYRRGGKSYTYLTICDLYNLYNVKGKINFIIGTDAFDYIENWYEADKLKEIVRFLVFTREENFDISRYNILKEKGYDFEVQSLPFEDISSTELRQKIKNNEDISDYLPLKVKDYIEKNDLYKV